MNAGADCRCAVELCRNGADQQDLPLGVTPHGPNALLREPTSIPAVPFPTKND